MFAVDVGNTRLKIGFFSNKSRREGKYVLPVYAAECDSPVISELDCARRVGYTDELKITELFSIIEEPQDWFIAQTGQFPWNELQKQISELRPKDNFRSVSYKTDSFTVSSCSGVLFEVDVENRETVGLDRILAVFAASLWRNAHANELKYGTKSPVVIADAGTALTVDLLTADGHFGGGIIFPGLHSLAEAISKISPKLPPVKLQNLWDTSFPAKNTEKACSAGVIWGTIGVILHCCEIAHRLHYNSLKYRNPPEELPNLNSQWLPLLLTGGDAFVLYEGIMPAYITEYPRPSLFQAEQYLVLSGIAAVAENTGRF